MDKTVTNGPETGKLLQFPNKNNPPEPTREERIKTIDDYRSESEIDYKFLLLRNELIRLHDRIDSHKIALLKIVQVLKANGLKIGPEDK